MLKDLLARFKRVFTVAEWKREAQDAMRRKEFVVESLDELHRVEKSEVTMQQERTMARTQGPGRNAQSFGGANPFQADSGAYNNAAYNDMRRNREEEAREKKRQDISLAALMNAIRQQQESM